MPGSVANAVVSTVMPALLASQFTRSDSWAVQQNTYANGEIESRSQVTSPLREWQCDFVGSDAEIAELKAFRASTKHGAFYFYDLLEPIPGQPNGSNYDPTGALSQGRYKVGWEGPWRQQMNMGRMTVALVIRERA